MSHQLTFADSEFSTKRRQTRKEIFLSRRIFSGGSSGAELIEARE
ncbi:hypothetical protein ON005_27660 [Klebsiella pneumoniae]|nr:hypothetical protein [Klebsiella pneumoniae]UZK95198.1 hypothetical protein ON005_27660 [Klebsiella pneumoniae]